MLKHRGCASLAAEPFERRRISDELLKQNFDCHLIAYVNALGAIN
jgi:hypothetical protein